MQSPQNYYRQLLGRALVLLGMAYMLSLGGTYNGILDVTMQRVTLGLLTVGVVLWQITYGYHHQLRRAWTPLDLGIVGWGAAFAISVAGRFTGRATIGLWYAGVYLGVWFILSDLRQRGLPARWLTDAALLTMIPLIILALMQTLPWFPAWWSVHTRHIDVAFAPPRPPSTLGNPNVFGSVLAMLIPFGLVRVRWSLRRLDRVLWGVWVFFALVTLYFTYSRGAWLGLAAALATMGGSVSYRMGAWRPAVLRQWWEHFSRRVRLALLGAGVGFLLVSLALLIASLDSFNTPQRSTSDRVGYYEIAAKDFAAHPWRGMGPFSFGLSLLEQRSIPPQQPQAHAHNLILNVAAEMGLPGLAALLVSLVLIVRQGLTRIFRASLDGREWAYLTACAAAFAAVGVHTLVDMPVMVPSVMVLLIVILAVWLVSPRDRVGGSWNRSWFWLRRAAQVTVWGIVLGAGWWSAAIYADYVRGQQLVTNGDYAQGAAILTQVADNQPSLALYNATSGYAYGLAAFAGDRTAIQPGIRAYTRALEQEPPHAVWWANLSALYWQNSDTMLAINAMRNALTYAPDDPDLWLNLGVYYETSGQISGAEHAYQETLALNERWGQPRFWLATPLRQRVLEAYPVAPTPAMQAQELWHAGRHQAAIDVLWQVLEHDPAQPGPYIAIARLYAENGLPQRAQDYLDAAYLLLRTDMDAAWIDYVEAELAYMIGDGVRQRAELTEARRLVLPDSTGWAILYGNDVANLQFLRMTTHGVLLPQLTLFGPDPVLNDLLQLH